MTRLGVDYLDLYIIHRFDYSTPMAETMEALGASAMYGYQLHNLQRVADENGWTRLSSLQNHYNLLYREDERELIPVVRQYGMSLTPYSPLASGLTLADHANCALRQLGTEPSRAHSDSPSRDSEQTPGRFRTSSHRS